MSFTESNTVEAYVRDLLAGPIKATPPNVVPDPALKALAGATQHPPMCRAKFRKCWSNPGCAMRLYV